MVVELIQFVFDSKKNYREYIDSKIGKENEC